MSALMASASTVADFESKVSRSYFPYEIVRVDERESFRGRIDTGLVGPATLTRAFANRSFCGRRMEQSGIDQHSYILHYVEEGHIAFVEGRTKVLVSTGDLILMSSQQSLVTEQIGSARAIALNLPSSLLKLRCPQVDSWCLSPRPSNNGIGAVLRKTLSSYWQERDFVTSYNETPLVNVLLDLINATFRPQPAADVRSNAVDQHFARVQELVALHFADMDLSPEFIASRLGVSRSYLYAIMNMAGVTLGQLILEHKLLRARDLLRNDQRNTLSIADIATATGFRSVAHFSRRFNERFGAPPHAHRLLSARKTGCCH